MLGEALYTHRTHPSFAATIRKTWCGTSEPQRPMGLWVDRKCAPWTPVDPEGSALRECGTTALRNVNRKVESNRSQLVIL